MNKMIRLPAPFVAMSLTLLTAAVFPALAPLTLAALLTSCSAGAVRLARR